MRTEPPEHKNDVVPHWLRDPTVVESGLASFSDMVAAVKERAQTARAFVPPRLGLNKSRGATSAAPPVGVMEQRLYDELDGIALQLDSGQRRRTGRGGGKSTSALKAIVNVVDKGTKTALDAALLAAQAISKLEGHTFFWTAHIDVEDDPGKTNAVKQYVTSAVVQNGWTASHDYLRWVLTSWNQRYNKAEYTTRLRNLLHREAELEWQERHLRGELFRDVVKEFRSSRINERGTEDMYLDEVAISLEIDARVETENLVDKRRELGQDARWLALQTEHEKLTFAANLSQRNVKSAFTRRPNPSAPWPWRHLHPIGGYRPERVTRPGWPLASRLRGEDIDDRNVAKSLRFEGYARSTLGETLANIGIYSPTDRIDVTSQVEVLSDAAWTLRASGWLLQQLAGDDSRHCKVCGAYLRKADRLYCRSHNESSSNQSSTPSRTRAYRLSIWAKARIQRRADLANHLVTENTHITATESLMMWWKTESATPPDDCVRYINALRPWTGDVLCQRLLTLFIHLAGSAKCPAHAAVSTHPADFFGWHFAEGSHADFSAVLPQKILSLNDGSPSRLLPSSHLDSQSSRNLSATLLHSPELTPHTVLAQLLTERAWIEIGGDEMDKRIRSKSHLTSKLQPPFNNPNRIDHTKLLELYRSGHKQSEIARIFGVSRAAVFQALKKHLPQIAAARVTSP